jgi:hypothetical protein
LRTSDWDNPNWRAIKDGLMPALNAARTALICPRVNVTAAISVCRAFFVPAERFGTGASAGGDLPRRFASSREAVMSKSSSRSVRRLTAAGRSLGKMYRCSDIDEICFVDGADVPPSGAVRVENRSGVLAECDHVPWHRLCRHP